MKATVEDQVNKEAGVCAVHNFDPSIEVSGSEQSAEVQQGSSLPPQTPTPSGPKSPTKKFTKSSPSSQLPLIPEEEEGNSKKKLTRGPSLMAVLVGSHWAEEKKRGLLEHIHL